MNNQTFSTIQKKQVKLLYYATFALFLPIFAGIFFLFTHDTQKNEVLPEEIQIGMFPQKISLDNVVTSAHSALVINLQTGDVLYEKRSDTLLPLASLTKLVTSKIAFDARNSETISIQKNIEFQQYGDSRLSNNEIWSTSDLITYTLLTSSNDGAHSLLKNSAANTLSFTQKMNSFVATIGLVQTEFKNETGLDHDDTGIPNSKGTALEMGKLLKYLVKDNLSLFEKTKYTQVNVNTPHGKQVAFNTNATVDSTVGILMSKTGYTDLAGGNLVIVADMGLNEPTAFVILKSSRESRFDDVFALQNDYFAQLREGMKK